MFFLKNTLSYYQDMLCKVICYTYTIDLFYLLSNKKIVINLNFSFCPEITTKIGLKKIKIKEVPIKYSGRNYNEGKKIRLIDGIKAIITLLKYRFF
jgi:hypothetical protein